MTFSFLFPSFGFEEGHLLRGARYFLYPNVEFLQIANFLAEGSFSYLDERIESKPEGKLGDVVFLYTPLEVSFQRIKEMAEGIREKGKVVILFGPWVSQEREREFLRGFSYVKGNILSVFLEIKQDLEKGRLSDRYDAGGLLPYLLPRWDLRPPSLNRRYQSISFALGCFCPQPIKPFCPQAIYYGDKIRRRAREEIIGEVVTLPYKRVFLLDEDIAFDLDYYREIFSNLWLFKKEWVVNASKEILEHPNFLRFLGKAGVRVMYLKEDFLPSEELYSLGREEAKEKRKGVKRIQSERILVGIKMAVFLQEKADYEPIVQNILLIDPDFIEVRFFRKDGEASLVHFRHHPLESSQEPIWLKSRFYSFRSIFSRLIKRPRRVGLYTTLFYSLPLSLYYRQNFLEGIPYPP